MPLKILTPSTAEEGKERICGHCGSTGKGGWRAGVELSGLPAAGQTLYLSDLL